MSDKTITAKRMKLHQAATGRQTGRQGQELHLYSHNPSLDTSELQRWYGDKAVKTAAKIYYLVERKLPNERITTRILAMRLATSRGETRLGGQRRSRRLSTTSVTRFSLTRKQGSHTHTVPGQNWRTSRRRSVRTFGERYTKSTLFTAQGLSR